MTETVIQYFSRQNAWIPFWNHEEKKPASNSYLRRKIEEGSFLINGERVASNELVDFPVFSVVLYPKSDKKRCTF